MRRLRGIVIKSASMCDNERHVQGVLASLVLPEAAAFPAAMASPPQARRVLQEMVILAFVGAYLCLESSV